MQPTESATEQPTEQMPIRLADSTLACETCGMPLAVDQRYCLDCGEPRAAVHGPLNAREPSPPATQPLAYSGEPRIRSFGSANSALAGIGCLLLAMGVGVLIGRSGSSSKATPAAPQVISVAGGGSAIGVASSNLTDDWPSGTHGYTVELQTLTDAAGVPAAKAAAGSKGAPAVGALHSDNYTGLPAGSYIVYSGVYPKRAQADKALGRLKAKFPAAAVIAVNPSGASAASSGPSTPASTPTPGKTNAKAPAAVKQLQGLTGKDYVKKAKQLPNVIATGGQPPPVDKSKPAGGGTGFTTIG